MSEHLLAGDIRARKGGVRLAMLTAYDYPTAMALEAAGVDIILSATASARWSSGSRPPGM